MKAVLEFLDGKKTYIVGALVVIVSGLYAQGYITKEQYDAALGFLGGLGAITLRSALKK